MVPVAEERIQERDLKRLGHQVPAHVCESKLRLAFSNNMISLA